MAALRTQKLVDLGKNWQNLEIRRATEPIGLKFEQEVNLDEIEVR